MSCRDTDSRLPCRHTVTSTKLGFQSHKTVRIGDVFPQWLRRFSPALRDLSILSGLMNAIFLRRRRRQYTDAISSRPSVGHTCACNPGAGSGSWELGKDKGTQAVDENHGPSAIGRLPTDATDTPMAERWVGVFSRRRRRAPCAYGYNNTTTIIKWIARV